MSESYTYRLTSCSQKRREQIDLGGELERVQGSCQKSISVWFPKRRMAIGLNSIKFSSLCKSLLRVYVQVWVAHTFSVQPSLHFFFCLHIPRILPVLEKAEARIFKKANNLFKRTDTFVTDCRLASYICFSASSSLLPSTFIDKGRSKKG